MRFDILTLFPEMFEGPLRASILGRARENGLVEVVVHDIRDYATDRHRTADDTPYGGGAGMVLKAEPIFRAAARLFPGWVPPGGAGDAGEESHAPSGVPDSELPGEPEGGREGSCRCGKVPGARVVYLTPQGRPLDQSVVGRLARERRVVLLCGHYEGVDERVRLALVDEEISIGDYVLTGGELPAMVVIDAVARLVPGVLGRETSPLEDSFAEGLLEHPHYTRPADIGGMRVPEVLLSGHHEMVRKWRRREALRRTLERRPELLLTARLTPEDRQMLWELAAERPCGRSAPEAGAADERGSE